MPLEIILKAIIGLLPVLVLVNVLYHLDSHRLLGSHFLVTVFAAGGVIAIVSALINGYAIEYMALDFNNTTRYVSPPIEESLKAKSKEIMEE